MKILHITYFEMITIPSLILTPMISVRIRFSIMIPPIPNLTPN